MYVGALMSSQVKFLSFFFTRWLYDTEDDLELASDFEVGGS